MLDSNLLGVLMNRARHGRGSIGLVVEHAGQPGDESVRHEFADKHHAALIASPYVETQVDFGEMAIPRPRHAQHARAEEVERNQAHERVAVAQVEVEPLRQTRPQ